MSFYQLANVSHFWTSTQQASLAHADGAFCGVSVRSLSVFSMLMLYEPWFALLWRFALARGIFHSCYMSLAAFAPNDLVMWVEYPFVEAAIEIACILRLCIANLRFCLHILWRGLWWYEGVVLVKVPFQCLSFALTVGATSEWASNRLHLPMLYELFVLIVMRHLSSLHAHVVWAMVRFTLFRFTSLRIAWFSHSCYMSSAAFAVMHC